MVQYVFFFKQKTAYEVRISDWSSDVCSSDLRLPYDVVFVLNRYFTAMGTAVEQAGGRIDKFIGDGVMALFGIEQGVEQGSRNALAAARHMAQSLEELNRSLAHDLPAPLRIGIGLHRDRKSTRLNSSH